VSAVALSPGCVEAIARRVAELLREDAAPASGHLLDASELAERFGCSRDWIYDNQERLGVMRLGDGPRAPLRFDPEHVTDALTPRPFKPREPKRSKPRRRTPSGGLLPIKGHEPTLRSPSPREAA
jgi:hypothetical protein